jgi:hypothetical protein
VIEHTVSPAACLNDTAAFLVPCIVFSQPLQRPTSRCCLAGGRYIGHLPRNGHASIFTEDAFARLAAGSGLVFHRGDQLHGMAPADATQTWPTAPCVHSARATGVPVVDDLAMILPESKYYAA